LNVLRTHIVRYDSDSADIYTALVTLVDDACMAFTRLLRRNARRIAHIAVALLPLMVLLVGSCKTSGLAGAYGGNTGPEQFRIALFPDSVNADAAHYVPAAGYVSRAQTYIKGDPASLKLLTAQEVSYLFGAPAMRRHDADAQVWQYKTSACIVDFYFYQDPAHTAQRPVSYVDVRPKGGMPADVSPEQARARCIGRAIDEAVFPAGSKA
jgi:hypothetical protein